MDTYEKKYKEALEKARQLCAYPTSKPFISDLQDLFPELTESNDERIRKELIDAILGLWDNDALPMPLSVKRKDEWIAWLEKQGKETSEKEFTFKALPRLLEMIEVSDRAKAYTEKLAVALDNEGYHTDAKIVRESIKIMNGEEVPMATMDEQKPVDNIEPKFKVGDWITNGDYTWKIVEVKPLDYILQAQDGNIVDDTISYVDEQFHSFTVKDAKDGDVLCTYECGTPKIVFILKGTPKKYYALGYHCYYNIMYPHFGPDSEKGCLAPNDEDVKPATKEQRDTLERAITNAGYTFNFEKKELKKIKQKPQRMVSAEAKEALYDKPTDEEMKELLRTEYEKGRADTIAEMKKDYSEDDESNKLLSLERKACITKTIEWFFMQLNEGDMECKNIEKFVANYKKYMEE